MQPDNIAIVRRWFEEVWNQRRTETIDDLLTEESVWYTDEGPVRGPHEFKQRQYEPLVAAFPNIRVEIDVAVEEWRQVVVRWTAIGRHSGDGLGFPPTHEPVKFSGISSIQVRNGKLMEGWQSSNISEVVKGLAARAPA